MDTSTAERPVYKLKEPGPLSDRIKWLRDYYFKGVEREWNNEFTAWTTGTPWDVLFDEIGWYVVPETYAFFQTFRSSAYQAARPVKLHEDFWKWSMVNYVPQEILPGDLIAGARFNILASRCWTEQEAKERDSMIYGKKGARAKLMWFHNHGYGNAGAISGHIIPGHEKALKIGFKGIYADLEKRYEGLTEHEKKGPRGAQLRAMMTAATMPRELAKKYASLCRELSESETDQERKQELIQMAKNLERVPWEPAQTFWEAVQALWLNHMLIMSDENYPGPGVSFGRIDQYLLPYWRYSIEHGMTREFGKEILKCFWIHANTAYDAMMKLGGNQGITSGYGQLISLSGLGKDGKDMTNELTFAMLEVIDELSPILEPKPNIRLHRNSPDELLDKVVDMISSSQGSPFLLNFDERSMAGMLREAKMAGKEDLINEENVYDYASVGCLENTMVGNDRSGTVDNNLNLLKAVELALTGGKDLLPFIDPITGKKDPIRQDGPNTGDATKFTSWEEFWNAYVEQTRYIVNRCVDMYEASESVRAKFSPTPYLSCLVKGCAEKGLDVTLHNSRGSDVCYHRGLTPGHKVPGVRQEGMYHGRAHSGTQGQLGRTRAPKYGRDDDEADEMARKVMDLWADEVWKYKTKSTNRQFRPGMLSWNYWIADGYILAASPDGRRKGEFLSNAICPSNGADINGPTANANSVGKALGGKAPDGKGDWKEYLSNLPNGASHTITFNPSLVKDPDHKEKFKAYLRGYAENGGSSLQINMVDADMLKEAQAHPQNYRNLLVRVTGYNAYFTSIGRELQDEIIARESHTRL